MRKSFFQGPRRDEGKEFSEQAIALENEEGKKPQLDDSKPGLTSGKRALPINVQVRSVSSEKTNKRTRPE